MVLLYVVEICPVRPTLESYFGQPIGQRILLVGCGLSTIASQLHAMGYRCITALDISATAIALMQAEDQDKEGIECKCAFETNYICMRSTGRYVCVYIRGYTHPH